MTVYDRHNFARVREINGPVRPTDAPPALGFAPMADERDLERLLGRPVANATKAAWGFTNRTDMVELDGGDRVVVQRYRRRADAERRLATMRALHDPAAAAGIATPRVRDADLDAQPPWVVFDVLPGVPIPEAGDTAFDGPRFRAMVEAMGELLATFRSLQITGLALDDTWADPHRLATAAAGWADAIDGLDRPAIDAVLARLPQLFAGRPAVLAHGDFAPVNVLTDGTTITGLLDFEAVRLADPLFDPAWWAWAMSFASSSLLTAVWPAFLRAAKIDPGDSDLTERVHALQILRMLELLADEGSLDGPVRDVVHRRLVGSGETRTETTPPRQ